jgi:acetolactate synthase-1/2/3 large subunit
MAEEYIDLPVDIQKAFIKAPAFRPLPPQTQIDEALAQLSAAKRPIIVVGGGAIVSGAQDEILKLAELMFIPIATALNAKGAISDTHQLSVGVVGSYSRDCANKAVARADLVFFIGSRTGSQVTNSWTVPSPSTAVIHLDIEGAEIGRNYPSTTPIIGDVKGALGLMIQSVKIKRKSPNSGSWLQEVRSLVDEWRKQEASALKSNTMPIRPERLCHAISNVLPDNGIVVSDTGHSGMWSSTMIDFTKPGQRYIRCAGSLGWSFPAALGVKCAMPDRTVVCFNGDGAFYYHLAELETAARCGINLVVVVNNNAALNQEIQLVDNAYKNLSSKQSDDLWRLRQVDFAAIAETFGCVGMRVTDPKNLESTIAKAIGFNKPVVVDVITDVTAMAKNAWRPMEI